MELTVSGENYLRAIDRLDPGDGARISDIAAELGVTKASTCRAVSQLEKRRLVERTAAHRVKLTEAGARSVERLLREIGPVKRFFVRQLEMGEEQAATVACALTHLLCENDFESLQRYCGKQG